VDCTPCAEDRLFYDAFPAAPPLCSENPSHPLCPRGLRRLASYRVFLASAPSFVLLYGFYAFPCFTVPERNMGGTASGLFFRNQRFLTFLQAALPFMYRNFSSQLRNTLCPSTSSQGACLWRFSEHRTTLLLTQMLVFDDIQHQNFISILLSSFQRGLISIFPLIALVPALFVFP